MIFYITVLRALAAMLITNAHYVGVYPTDIIANGGLLGDVIFFAVSGFCLYHIKDNFIKWYKKRLIRVYPVTWIITTAYLLIGFYNLEKMNIFEYMLYPTYYHFIASIILLYIIYYIYIYIYIQRCGIADTKKNLKSKIDPMLFGFALTFIVQLIIYLTVYDKSYYHIDTVREWMIRFLFFESMLLGAYFRKNIDKYMNKNKISNWILTFLIFIVYFASKILLVKGIINSQYQLINQIILLILLYYVFKSFSGIDEKLRKLPNKIKQIIEFIANITLEIYLVQYPIIPLLKNIIFPLNWIAITITIIILAYILYIIKNKILGILPKQNNEENKKQSENIINRSN